MQKRIGEAMRKDGEDKKKLEKADERINYRIAKDIEKADRKRKSRWAPGGAGYDRRQ